jgi:hypothetical protein
MAAQYKVGVQTSTEVKEELSLLLREALSDLEAKERYRPAIQACAQAEFDAQKMREVLRNCFRQCAQAVR